MTELILIFLAAVFFGGWAVSSAQLFHARVIAKRQEDQIVELRAMLHRHTAERSARINEVQK